VSPGRVALIVVAGLAAALAAGRSPSDAGVRLLFTGDILLSRQVGVEMSRTGASPFDAVVPLFESADWVAGNLEGAIGYGGGCPESRGTLCFAFPDTSPALLARAAFDGVFLENNHAADLGPEGRVSTLEALRSAGILGIDFDHSPQFVRLGEVTVAAIAVSLVAGADGRAQDVPSVAVAQRLRLARTLASLVVVSVHWGTELQDWPSGAQRGAADWLVEGGADLVVGHHPHVVQPPECVRGRPVFYSLGNHVFDQRYPDTKNGLIADCRVRGGRLRCGAIRTHTRQGSAMPVASGPADVGTLDACQVALPSPPVVSGYTLRPVSWHESNSDDGVVIEGWRDGAFRWRSPPVALVSLETGLAAEEDDGLLFSLERHYSPMDREIGLRPHVYAVGDDGLIARWRGTALAWPLIDALVDRDGSVCALHRGDAFIRPDPLVTSTRAMRYRWNGFGFSGVADGAEWSTCPKMMSAVATRTP
jgi:poly-gamma-glutamate synthesis protein (capsule biosynthesis protein)